MSYTKGPWECEISEDGGMFFVYGKDRMYVASNEFCDAEEVAANARLITAAPELALCLEAMLKIACGNCEGEDGRCVTADGFDACLLARQAKAVLQKVRGENDGTD